MKPPQDIIINVSALKTYLGNSWVHQGIDLMVKRGEILAIVGGSGSGKTTLLRAILGLLTPQSGAIELFGKNILLYKHEELRQVQRRYGVLFQQGALFSALTVAENIMFPMQLEESLLPYPKKMRQIALEKIHAVGLPKDAADKYPSELSGGMQKRAALARALALDPELLFLDEPASGLDPVSASAQDQLFLQLHQRFGLTIVMVTHDLDTLASTAQKIVFLGEGKILAQGSLKALMQSQEPQVHAYFHTARARVFLHDNGEG